MNFKNLLFKVILLLILLPFTTFGQQKLIEDINKELIPIKLAESSYPTADFAPLKTKIEDRRIIALGEATHGTHEFFTLKNSIVKYLVKEMGFKVFVIEADFTGAQAMNDYIIKGNGNPKNALVKMGIGVWFTDEFLEMIEWMKGYNEMQTPENKVRFYGCDMQYATNSGKALIDGTVKFKKPLSEDAIKGIKLIIDYSYGQIDNAKIPLLNLTVKELNESAIDENDSLKLALDKRYVTSVLQTIEYAKASKFIFDKNIIRDERMADNCEWIYHHENNTKMILWAHNLHIAKNITRNDNLPMGYYLSQKFPNYYYAIGFDFNKGDFRAYNTQSKKYEVCSVPEVTSKKSVEYVFKQCSSPTFFLDFESIIKNSLIDDFINKNLDARAIGGAYNPNKQSDGKDGTDKKLKQMYNGILFVNETTAVKMLN